MKRPRLLVDIGEERVVSDVIRRLRAGRDVIVGAGDDCAVLASPKPALNLLLKTDAIVEGVHFLPGTAPAKVGWKAACRAVSDVAAMGGWPLHALVTLVVSPACSFNWVRGLYTGLNKAAQQYGFSIVGGETCRMPQGGPTVIGVSMLGEVEKGRCILRSGARVGDAIFVTGQLGGSIRGWHLSFRPRVDEAIWLARNFRPTTMIDVSDGLAKDLPRLAVASGVGFIVDPAALPRRRGCTTEQALGDGEDYELLFTLPSKKADGLVRAWRKRFSRLRLTRIGNIAPQTSSPTLFEGATGWDHFKPVNPRTKKSASEPQDH